MFIRYRIRYCVMCWRKINMGIMLLVLGRFCLMSRLSSGMGLLSWIVGGIWGMFSGGSMTSICIRINRGKIRYRVIIGCLMEGIQIELMANTSIWLHLKKDPLIHEPHPTYQTYPINHTYHTNHNHHHKPIITPILHTK